MVEQQSGAVDPAHMHTSTLFTLISLGLHVAPDGVQVRYAGCAVIGYISCILLRHRKAGFHVLIDLHGTIAKRDDGGLERAVYVQHN